MRWVRTITLARVGGADEYESLGVGALQRVKDLDGAFIVDLARAGLVPLAPRSRCEDDCVRPVLRQQIGNVGHSCVFEGENGGDGSEGLEIRRAVVSAMRQQAQ